MTPTSSLAGLIRDIAHSNEQESSPPGDLSTHSWFLEKRHTEMRNHSHGLAYWGTDAQIFTRSRALELTLLDSLLTAHFLVQIYGPARPSSSACAKPNAKVNAASLLVDKFESQTNDSIATYDDIPPRPH